MTDLISKQMAIDIAKELTIISEGYEMHNQAVMNYCVEIMQLPFVQPEHKGRWIQLTCDSAEWWYCSECNGRVQMNPWVKYNYCPNCGADMRGESNE